MGGGIRVEIKGSRHRTATHSCTSLQVVSRALSCTALGAVGDIEATEAVSSALECRQHHIPERLLTRPTFFIVQLHRSFASLGKTDNSLRYLTLTYIDQPGIIYRYRRLYQGIHFVGNCDSREGIGNSRAIFYSCPCILHASQSTSERVPKTIGEKTRP